jgi:tetratricopeptide (TPR) repeat protein
MLSLLLKMFYAPGRAMAEARDRAPLGQAVVAALAAHGAYMLYVVWPFLPGGAGVAAAAWGVAGSLLFTAIVFVPVVIFVANIVERRAGFGVALQQEYAPVASTLLYARAAASLLSLPLAALTRAGGAEALIYHEAMPTLEDFARQAGVSLAEIMAQRPLLLAESFANMFFLPLCALWALVAVREVFRFSWPRAFAVVAASAVAMLPLERVVGPLFEWVFASPFLLLMLFLLMRGYLGGVRRGARARAAFRQNLEAATLNPADASAHYNLGLLHLQRRELSEARARFERAIEIDAAETDAHYQLGRIARAEGRWADAIAHYTEVVSRDPSHAQHEVWREAAATYVSARQYEDARDALERFLEHRPSDPEALYLMGRAHAGLGRRREAVEWLQRCIEAVRTSPAYKYRTEKRWATEAQQFMRSLA